MRCKITPTLTKITLGEVLSKDSNFSTSGKSAGQGPIKPYHIKNDNSSIASANFNSNMIKYRTK